MSRSAGFRKKIWTVARIPSLSLTLPESFARPTAAPWLTSDVEHLPWRQWAAQNCTANSLNNWQSTCCQLWNDIENGKKQLLLNPKGVGYEFSFEKSTIYREHYIIKLSSMSSISLETLQDLMNKLFNRNSGKDMKFAESLSKLISSL